MVYLKMYDCEMACNIIETWLNFDIINIVSSYPKHVKLVQYILSTCIKCVILQPALPQECVCLNLMFSFLVCLTGLTILMFASHTDWDFMMGNN